MLHSEYMSKNVTEELVEVPVGTTHYLSCTLTPTYTGSPVTATVKNATVFPQVQSQAVSGSVNMNGWVLHIGTVYVTTSGTSELSRLRMVIDLTLIKDSLDYNRQLVTLSLDLPAGSVLHAPYEVTGKFEGNNLVFDFSLYGELHNAMMPLEFGSGIVCDACYKRTVEYANPMRMILTQ